jgi:hypothetical protein
LIEYDGSDRVRDAMLGMMVVLCAALPWAAVAQVPAGAEFQVNTYTTNYQLRTAVAMDAAGNFVVLWRSTSQDGSLLGVFGQRYDAAGVPLGGEFQVNTYTTERQNRPAVAMGPQGDFVVVWNSGTQDGAGYGVFGQRYDAAGVPVGGEFQVNTYTTNDQSRPRVAIDATGNFVVVWRSYTQDGSNYGIFAQRYDAAGTLRGTEFQVNTYTTGSQDLPAVAGDPQGNFVVVWQSNYQDGDKGGIFGQRHDAAGAPVGGEFQVNTYTTESQSNPAVAMDAVGNFVVVWRSYTQDGSSAGVFGQRFDSTGARQGAEFQVNTYATGSQEIPAVAMDRSGSFVVVWESNTQDGNNDGIFGQRYDAVGLRRGSEFQVNTYTTLRQYEAAVAADPHGNFVVIWTSATQDGSVDGIFGQRYGGLLPAALTVDASGNGVLEPGETATVAPAWRNVNGGPLTFTGAASNLAGPPGATYTLADAAANYGTVANATVGSCGSDCYQVSVSSPATRPATHWDLTVRETIGPPASLGQTTVWTLDVGESFTDVPPAHLFYRFVEILLHVGVTAGCTATTYCPDGVTTREQMAVFLLRAREGGGYTPPACTTAPFPDVPCASPFGAWVKELVARGITAGCGGGLFCPTAPVTREQMAVFLLKTREGAAFTPPPCTTATFTDVPCSSPFATWVQELVGRGITAGCGGGLYCPTDPVTRGQMAVFLTKTFGLTLYGP